LQIESNSKIIIPNDYPAKISSKAVGAVEAFSAITNQGLSKNYNNDRISIVTNLYPPKERKHLFSSISQSENEDLPAWPKCCFFGIFDGHNGNSCAEFLRDNLHRYITS
jgi:protein phosphatase 2C family protein 2/3|tara:strand:- start:1611 stop:1937 length:327 start_codon:yes stop_codon:yes gene_type:complete